MKYEKQALSYEAQADLLIKRGLVAEREVLIQRLCAVSYYRLAGYLFPFRYNDGSETYFEGTTLDEVWMRYCFDRRLRVLMLDAIERIEVSIRSKLVYYFSHEHGPFGYCDDRNFPNLKMTEYLEWRIGLEEEARRSKELFKKHFFQKYGEDHKTLPLWMAAELMTMGSTLTFFRGVSVNVQKKISGDFGHADTLFLSWIRSLNAARNICAHHSRFWNRELGYQPLRPQKNKFPEWNEKNALPQNRCGIILMICRELLQKISPTSLWHQRIESLFDEFSSIPLQSMGLCPTWREHPIWKQR